MTAAITANQALAARILAFLSTFATMDDLAAECRKRGLKGDPSESCSCIIARLIELEFPETKQISVIPSTSCELNGHVSVDNEVEINLPKFADEFARAFDNRDYPDLESDDDDDNDDDGDCVDDEDDDES